MARIRTIKPEFWTDEDIGELSTNARLLFLCIWNHADDEGLIPWNPALMRSIAFAYDDMTLDEISGLMGELTRGGFIHPYKGPKGREYGWIINFRKHQKIDRPQPPKHPLPPWNLQEIRDIYAKRDNYICAICGEDIRLADGEHPLVLRLITPRKEGGTDAPSNIQIAHDECSMSNRGSFGEQSANDRGQFAVGREGKGRERKGKDKDKDSPRNKFTDADLETAQMIFSGVRAIHAGHREPNFDSWADIIRLMRERDGRTQHEIRQLFTWANNHEFWRANILSPEKLRKQWDNLIIKQKAENEKSERNSWSDNQRRRPSDVMLEVITPGLRHS